MLEWKKQKHRMRAKQDHGEGNMFQGGKAEKNPVKENSVQKS